MSHFTTIKTQIKDTQALKAACDELELELVPNAKARGYIGNTHSGEFVIKLKGPYDIALNKQDGAYGLTSGTVMSRRRLSRITASSFNCMVFTKPASKPGRKVSPSIVSRNRTARSNSC